MTLQPPFVPACANPPLPSSLPGESQGYSEMAGRCFLLSQPPRPAGEPMTADYRTSRSEAAIMRSWGFGSEIQVLGHAHSRSRGSIVLIPAVITKCWCS